ncbi:MAG: cobyric acid synthase CobQ, partial [Lachnospiraceae bacterium]|nr:cobyric acid synthase CobQ [Lachnospiraceae bacterium]
CEEGLGLLPVDTILETEKVTANVTRMIMGATGILRGMEAAEVEGYELHMGKTLPYEDITEFTSSQTGYCSGNVYGTYLHGFFDKKDILVQILQKIAMMNGKVIDIGEAVYSAEYKDRQNELLAKGLKESLDMHYIYEIMGLKNDD